MLDFWLLVGLIILVILLVLSAFFSASEIALVSLNAIRIRHKAENGKKEAIVVQDMMKNPQRIISSIVVGNNIVNILASVLATAISMKLFGNVGVAVATGILTIIILIFCEITPKAFAIRNEKFALRIARPVAVIIKVLWPMASILTYLSNFLIHRFGGKPVKRRKITEEEIKTMLKVAEEEGGIEEDEKEMINNVFEFDETRIREVMTPKKKIIALDEAKTVEDALHLIRKTGISRIPIYRENINNVLGMVHVKDLLDKSRTTKLYEIVQPIIRIKTTEKVDEVLRKMQKRGIHLAVVLDKSEQVVGIVSMEDLLEELVGEIADEYDKQNFMQEKKKL